jgi:hypothetical protein
MPLVPDGRRTPEDDFLGRGIGEEHLSQWYFLRGLRFGGDEGEDLRLGSCTRDKTINRQRRCVSFM